MRISDWSSDVCSSDLLGGKREARQALGTAEVLRQRNLAESARLEVASRTTARYIAVAAAQQRLEFARERVKLAERARAEVDRWVTAARNPRSEEHTSELQSLMRISYAVFCLKKKNT